MDTDRFRLLFAVEDRDLPGGLEVLLRSDLERMAPPPWAADIELVTYEDRPDAVLFLFEGDPSDRLRRLFFSCFRQGMPLAALCHGEPASGESIYSRLRSSGTWWVFRDAAEARGTVSSRIAPWIGSIRRDIPQFPSGSDLLASYGEVDPSSIDAGSLEKARSVLARRGFVCLGGQLGAGKTTLARHLLVLSASEGLTPVELISVDLDVTAVERLLTGPEDCAVFWDLDTLRRFTDLWPSHLWNVALSLMIRATESGRRLILASSSPRIEEIFDSYGDASIRLPEPSGRRDWRLEQGRKALRDLLALDRMKAAEQLLLAAFDPEVSEGTFRPALMRMWERISILESSRFPSRQELERRYSDTGAAGGRTPFRRFSLAGETHLTAGDTTMLVAVDQALEELIRRRDPVIRILGDVLLGSRNARSRKAGLALANFYPGLAADEKSALLHSIAREEDSDNLWDVLAVLLKDPDTADEGVVSICANLAGSRDPEVRKALAEACAKPWARRDAKLSGVISSLLSDERADVRGSLMHGIGLWGVEEDPSGCYARLLEDGSADVKVQITTYIGRRFPDISAREMEFVNALLQGEDSRLLQSLAWGLLNRSPDEFTTEFTDLLWLLLGRLPPGGKGLVARQIGGRLRYFDGEIREALVSNLESESDRSAVLLCLLMNHSWLTKGEQERLWTLAAGSVASGLEFATLVLSYSRAFDPDQRRSLVRTVLSSEEYEGREALGQLLARNRIDLAETSVSVCREMLAHSGIEERARLPWFVLWNSQSLGDGGIELLDQLASDQSPVVRSSLARAILKQGCRGPVPEKLLEKLAGDPERSVRAFVGEALGRLSGSPPAEAGPARVLASDEDPSVRARTLAGVLDSTTLRDEERLPFLAAAAADPSRSVRRELVAGLAAHQGMLALEGAEKLLSSLLSDSDDEVRIESLKLVTSSPSLLASDTLRRKLPDLLLDRYSTGATISEELNTAREIQMEFLPDRPPRLESYDIEFYYSPAREVGGDYYDFFQFPEENLGIAVGDVSGKGIPAALTMASLKGYLGANVRNLYSISEVMKRVNESLSSVEDSSNLVGLFYGVLDSRTGLITYVNAGHNPPVLIKREGQSKLLSEGGLLLGAFPDAEYDYGIVSMETADVLVLYTDGITEALDTGGREFGLRALVELCTSLRDLSSRQIVSRVIDAVNRHSRGAPRSDDQTLVVIRHR